MHSGGVAPRPVCLIGGRHLFWFLEDQRGNSLKEKQERSRLEVPSRVSQERTKTSDKVHILPLVPFRRNFWRMKEDGLYEFQVFKVYLAELTKGPPVQSSQLPSQLSSRSAPAKSHGSMLLLSPPKNGGFLKT